MQEASDKLNMDEQAKQAIEQAKSVLVKLPLVGPILWLFAHDPMRRYLFAADFEWAVMPSLVLDQAKLYMKGQAPLGFASWAFVSDAVQARLIAGQPRLAPHEWKSGENLWLIDVVAPFGGTEDLIKDLREKVFPTRAIKALVPDTQKKVLQVREWPAFSAAQSPTK